MSKSVGGGRGTNRSGESGSSGSAGTKSPSVTAAWACGFLFIAPPNLKDSSDISTERLVEMRADGISALIQGHLDDSMEETCTKTTDHLC